MSQDTMLEELTLFDEGFDVGEEKPADEPQVEQEQTEQNADAGVEENTTEQEQTQEPEPAPQSPQQTPMWVEQQQPVYQPSPAQQVYQQPAQQIEIPDAIKNEWEELQKVNPAAAQLAKEDSAEGEAIRKRLELYGADLANDRAERVIENRNRSLAAQQQQQAQIDAYNRDFAATMQREQPGYVAMMSDPNRRAEAQKYQQDIHNWIYTKPYGEGQNLMRIAQSGTAKEVSQLITRFERERQGAKGNRPDPTGALAVPGRGAPVAPTGIGDKDSFDAGWDLNTSN